MLPLMHLRRLYTLNVQFIDAKMLIALNSKAAHLQILNVAARTDRDTTREHDRTALANDRFVDDDGELTALVAVGQYEGDRLKGGFAEMQPGRGVEMVLGNLSRLHALCRRGFPLAQQAAKQAGTFFVLSGLSARASLTVNRGRNFGNGADFYET